ncbi:MAG TPA: ATP-grasp domain-containing protein [Xanthobacteraceae bacterium]|nr:ATP-grasp domain-containing protein [Xanthobacteraceae bacterium]
MPSRSPEPWPKADADLVLIGLSARTLAASAGRAGLRAVAIDLFGDEDTRALAPTRRLNGASQALAFEPEEVLRHLAAFPGVPVVLGAGFEAVPELIDAIAARAPLLGNDGRTVAAFKDPFALAGLLEQLGIAHPAVYAGAAPAGRRVLEKQSGASGGGHVRRALQPEASPSPGCYLQDEVEGNSVSALFLGNGQAARLIGFSEQWCAPAPHAPFRYGGAAAPLLLPAVQTAEVAGALNRLVAATGLRGLASADLMLTATGWSLIEINPRPGATLDIFDRAPLPPLLHLHIAACRGVLPDELPALATMPACAAAVFYALSALSIDQAPLPEWTADRPAAGSLIAAGAPLCTVLASGRDLPAARRTAGQRMAALSARLQDLNQKHEPTSRLAEAALPGE